MSSYRHLLEPLAVGPVRLRNRMVMGAMHTRLETLDRPGERLAAFFATRAEGEVGLILTGGFSPNAEGRIEEGSPVLDESSDLSQHRLICAAVHAAGGVIALQILHAWPLRQAPARGRPLGPPGPDQPGPSKATEHR